jgi:Iap family predicted aminopeptidase
MTRAEIVSSLQGEDTAKKTITKKEEWKSHEFHSCYQKKSNFNFEFLPICKC